MPIQNYPRFITKSSKTGQQLETGLPIVGSDGTTSDFNALKINADGSINVSGGGGGDATASNQITQINEANTTNIKIDILNNNVSLYSEQLNQTAELFNIVANTLQTQYNTADIKLNTDPSTNSNRKISDLLDSFAGNSTADILENIDFYQKKLVVNSKWHTWCTKIFNGSGGSPIIWNLVAFGGIYPTKIVFNENAIEINDLLDKTATSVLTQYFDSNGGTILVNNGTELLSVGKTADDHFTEITTTGNCHFTAYYLIDPYIAP